MTPSQYDSFSSVREEFRNYVRGLNSAMPWLAELQDQVRTELGYDDYRIETPVVYNEALDTIGIDSDIDFIFVADNPGKNEQKAANRRYLVGQAGKLAQSWFATVLGRDFRAAGIIINKTPIHTPKTAEISVMRKAARRMGESRSETFAAALEDSQRTMADLAFRLHASLGSILWISGYGELGPSKIFAPWTAEVNRLYAEAPRALREKVWVFRHFSMNQFAIEYKRWEQVADPMKRLKAIGSANRKRILGW